MIHPARITGLNSKPLAKGDYVLYWMQQSQRAEYNHALEYAIEKANELQIPPVVFFGITNNFPDANRRHYRFMLQGLRDVQASLEKRGIRFVVQDISPEKGAETLTQKASLLVTDRGYLKIQKKWRNKVAGSVPCSMVQVESDVVVPLETAVQKEQYNAAAIRSKITPQLHEFMKPLGETKPRNSSRKLKFKHFDISDIDKALNRLSINDDISDITWLTGGTGNANKILDTFISHKLDRFGDLRNDPSRDYQSHLSPYLHFGQISPLYVALKVSGTKSPGKDAFLEELIVRRELSMNFVHYNPHYDSLDAIPEWARATMKNHKKDKRPASYSVKELEQAATHDSYWNTAQKEMIVRGKMHGYMRMYWGKKIIEWSKSPEEAYEFMLYLNNKYFLDGRDPNSYTGVAWCFGKHDRAWKERKVFGKVRYMNDKGLKRKFDIEAYVKKVEAWFVS
ncbi:MAG: deoxyribodipyrimidine photolyase [Chitinivibrionales bacterium]|nr:deoxyribodipyrimidine photolyase [Chitinivibrionales bacterium]